MVDALLVGSVFTVVLTPRRSAPSCLDRQHDPGQGERDAIDAQRAEGHVVSEDAITHLSPAHFEAINSDGTLAFDIASVLKRSGDPSTLLTLPQLVLGMDCWPLWCRYSGDPCRGQEPLLVEHADGDVKPVTSSRAAFRATARPCGCPARRRGERTCATGKADMCDG